MNVLVAVEKTAYSFDRLFTYGVPARLESRAKPGARVLVSFGAGEKRRQGMIFALAEDAQSGGRELKNIVAVLDEEPVLDGELLAMAEHLSGRTFCPLFEAARAMLPPGINYRPVWIYSLPPEASEDEDGLSDEEKRVTAVLRKKRSGMDGAALQKAFGYEDGELFASMARRGILVREDGVRRKVGDDSAKMARLSAGELEERENGRSLVPKPTAKQREVLEFLEEAGAACVREIGYFTAATPAVAENLEKKGAVEFFSQPMYRRPYKDRQRTESVAEIVLSREQEAAFDGICGLFGKGARTALLFGVTGSGKTQVFMKLIDRVVSSGGQVILMVPEISLTPQMINKFIAFFGSRVAAIHSGLSVGERLDEWKRVREGQADIIIGTRSAVFAPAGRLALIIMDEEQEPSYKSDRSPRFHARDAAAFRSAQRGIPLLLASATPGIETYYRALTGKYELFTMSKRYGGAKLPETVIVDMHAETLAGNDGILSGALRDELKNNLERGQQSILLLNRRGYNTIARCADCGEVEECPRCSIPLIYHRANGRLMCHYCGYSKAAEATCKKCGSRCMMYSGVGTQKAEDEIRELLPAARVLRMDLDTTMAKFSHDKYFSEFSEGKYDIMIGTQMVAKGLDFPKVTLVGVLSADMSLYTGDYRSYERTFALLTQVVGRCGRAEMPGRAYIQTWSPEHKVIERSAAQDYPEFYDDEIINRRVMLYPPFCAMGAVGFTGTQESLTSQAAAAFSELLEATVTGKAPDMPIRILGPTPSRIAKIAGRWRWKLLVKYRPEASFFTLMSGVLREFAKDKRFVKIEVTADPYFDGIV